MTSMSRIVAAQEAVPAQAGARPAPRPAALVRDLREALPALADEWAALALSASEPNPFAEHWFVAAAMASLPEAARPYLIEVRRAGRLIGLLPVAPERGYARLPVRFTANWQHDQMFLGTPLVAAGEEAAFWRAVLATLDAADWSGNFLHLRGLAEGGPVHRGLLAARGGDVAWREVRAFLQSTLGPQAYYEQAVRQKKRKELRRQRNRLAELGAVAFRTLESAAELSGWCDAYLALEKAGWKGEAGSAFACVPAKEAFFRNVIQGAHDAGRLQFLRLDVGDRPVAMLVNFRCAPGSFSFKTVFDEGYARFSPGVLIQIENLNILDDPAIAWMDSCAAEDHPMIDSLWGERRAIVRVTVPLKGARRLATFAACRALERAAAFTRTSMGRLRR